MNKKQYIKPVVLFEEMEVTDCILRGSNPGSAEIVSGTSEGYKPTNANNLTVSQQGINSSSGVGSKESDWSFDYSLDIDW